MANPSPNDLNYGHVGQAVFDLENGAWDFGRTIGQRNHLIQLGAWKEVLAPATKFGQIGTQRHAQTIHNAQFFARALGHNNPGLVPSLDLLPELAVTSSAVTSTVSAYDPAIGPLLSYGSFTFKDHHENPRRVAALPAGECGNILRLVALRKEKHGWGPDKSIWIEGPSIVSEESGYWAEDAAPIQQVCFAQGDMRSSFLAVRFPIRTVLFRPIYRADRTSPKRNEYYELPYSKIDAQFILDIHNEQTGGTAHADVVFNPDYQRQVGLVDQKGNWSVWDIEGGKREGKSYALSCTAQGNIALQDADQMQELEDSVPVTRDDAWARILWIGDVNTILVCNRRSIGIFDTRSKAPASLECAELIAKRSADWILDVKSHPRNKRQFFVLTSTRLFLLAVTCLNDVSHNSGANAGASVLMAWTHFQGSEDITLQLCVPTTSDEGKSSTSTLLF
jgi:RNA polymerase I-specific transcription initiation factor RRN6